MSDARWTKTRLDAAQVPDVVEGVEQETLAKWVSELAAHVQTLEAALVGVVALMERSDGVASIAHGPNGHEVGCIEWDWYEEVKALKAALAAVDAEKGNGDE